MVKGADKSIGIGFERNPSTPDGCSPRLRSGQAEQTSFIGCLVNNKTLLSLIFLEVRIINDFKSSKFGSADSARVTDRFRGSADCKGFNTENTESTEAALVRSRFVGRKKAGRALPRAKRGRPRERGMAGQETPEGAGAQAEGSSEEPAEV
jgi:hypothetical protein